MTTPLQTQMMLNNLQNQIAAISNINSQPNSTTNSSQLSPPPQFFNNIATPDIYSMITTAVQTEISKYGLDKLAQQYQQQTTGTVAQNMPNIPPSPTQTPQQNSAIANPNQLASILPIIGSAYTTEQQEWISQPQNLLGIPGFLMSKDGKDLLVMALDSYQQFCKGENKK